MHARLDHAPTGEGDGEVPLRVLTKVEVGELELVVLALDVQAPGYRSSGRSEGQIRSKTIVGEASTDAGESAADHPAGGVHEDHIGLRVGPHIGQYGAHRGRDQDATDHSVGKENWAGRDER